MLKLHVAQSPGLVTIIQIKRPSQFIHCLSVTQWQILFSFWLSIYSSGLNVSHIYHRSWFSLPSPNPKLTHKWWHPKLTLDQCWDTTSSYFLSRYRKLLSECCDPRRMFAVTKQNSPMGKVLWYDGEFYHSHTVNNETYSLFVQVGLYSGPGGQQCTGFCSSPTLTHLKTQ